MADAIAKKFIEDQLKQAGVKPSEDAILDYAMLTVHLLCEINAKLHERLVAQRVKLKRKTRRSDGTANK